MQLTKTALDRLKCDPEASAGYTIFWDSGLKGFGVRVTRDATKSFVLRFSYEGKRKVVTLGQYGIITLDEARKLAMQAQRNLALGENPFIKKKALLTVSEFVEVYWQRHGSKKKSADLTRYRLDRYILPAFGKTDLRRLDRGQITDKFYELSEHSKAEANQFLALMGHMWEMAVTWQKVPEEMPNPARRIKLHKLKSRERYIQVDEMPRVLTAIKEERNYYVRAALQLDLLTGLRRGELASLKWDFIDLTHKRLVLEDTKAGRSHYLPLSEEACEILRSVPRQLGNKYVFCGRGPKSHIAGTTLSKKWREIRVAANAPDVRLHDIRRTVGSWLANGNLSTALIGKVLNHTTPQATAIYARLHLDPVREALEKLSKQIKAAEAPDDGSSDQGQKSRA
jgi:integrase